MVGPETYKKAAMLCGMAVIFQNLFLYQEVLINVWAIDTSSSNQTRLKHNLCESTYISLAYNVFDCMPHEEDPMP